MELFHGIMTNHSDTTSDKYISINNFGYYKNIDEFVNTNREHGRKDYQLIYIDKGYGTFFLDDKHIRLSEGNVVIYAPHTPQKYWFNADSNATFYWIHFTGTGVQNLLCELNLKGMVFNAGSFIEFKEIFGKMIKDNAIGDISSPQLLNSHIISILSRLARKIMKSESKIHRVIEKMQLDFTNKLSNKDYAKICGVSEYHFIRKFKEETGFTPLQYKTKLIVSKAIDLFDTTNLNISEISHILGFDDSLYFSRVFKKETGISPKKYMENRKPLP